MNAREKRLQAEVERLRALLLELFPYVLPEGLQRVLDLQDRLEREVRGRRA
ncbi:MAG: hypothetical protein AB1505_17850 [Candidatus Latescibacterota bacterium]